MEDMMGKKKFRDRRDAKRIKMPAMMRLLTYLTDRQDADVYINRKVDVTNLVKYMNKINIYNFLIYATTQNCHIT